jgi:predicted aminopeptidase
MRRFKRLFLVLIALLIGFCLYYGEEVLYGIGQGVGQLKIVWNSRPVEEVLADPAYSESYKSKIRLIQEIRQFTIDSLGLEPSDNYTTFYDQQDKPVLWVVTASEPFKLKAKKWEFPFLGGFTYKGYFKLEKAQKEEENLRKEGWDTDIDEVSGWSTLGWFKDPILSGMLKRSPGSLANLIIHELTHGTLYVKDSIQFNENLANFVGDKGALKFLEYKFGKDSKEYKDYLENRDFIKQYREKVLKHADALDSLYIRIENLDKDEKLKHKKYQLSLIQDDLISFMKRNGRISKEIPEDLRALNNAYFLDFRRYNEELEQLETEFRLKFDEDLKSYIQYLKKLHPSL